MSPLRDELPSSCLASGKEMIKQEREGFITKASRKFVHHYAGVAIVVGLLSSFGTWTATRFVTASSAQPAPAAAKPLLVQPLADLPGRDRGVLPQ